MAWSARNWFALGRDRVWATPLVALVLVVAALAQALALGGDIRAGAFPWLIALAAFSLALLGVRLIELHGPAPDRLVLVGGWWTVLAFLGVAGFFVAVGIGSVLGIEEDAAGVVAWLPVISMAFGLLSMTPAVVLLAIGAGRSEALPRWGVWALWLVAPLLIVQLIFGGMAEGTAETAGTWVILALLTVGWVVVGLAVRLGDIAEEAGDAGAVIEFVAHLEIAQPPAVGFERLADMAELDRWNPNVTDSRRTAGDRLTVGSTYVSTIRRGPLRMTARSELTAIEKNRSVTYEGTIAGFHSTDSLTFQPHGSGTCITFSNQSQPPKWLRFLSSVFDVAFQPQARRAVEGARRYLEASAG